MRYFVAIFIFLLIAIVSIFGIRGKRSLKPPLEVFPDMDRQFKYHPQDSSGFFPDGRSDRPPVPGTVARGAFYEDEYFGTGQMDGTFASGFPTEVEIDMDLMKLGQAKYEIFCTVCHGATGDGNGITKQYGMNATPSYHQDRIREMPEGEIFNTITNGKNTMLSYGAKLTPQERWAVIAYLRALQRTRASTIDDVPPEHLKDLGL